MASRNNHSFMDRVMGSEELARKLKDYRLSNGTTVTDLSSGKVGNSRYTVFDDYMQVKEEDGKLHFFTATFMDDMGHPNFYIFRAKKDADGKMTHETLQNCYIGNDSRRHLVEGPAQDIYRRGLHGELKSAFVNRDYVENAVTKTA